MLHERILDFFEINVGADFVLGKIGSGSSTMRRFCTNNSGVESFENFASHAYEEGNSLSFGIQPFVGIRKVIWQRFALGIEFGVRFNRFFGEYPLLEKIFFS
ncbi:MAG: hypothetical protein ACI9XO_000518 [Paraglaciecola sp.]|jgi:hypothetical protein